MWLEHRVDITSHAGGIVGQGHGGTADDEYVCNDAPAGQALAKRSKGSLDLCPAEQNVIWPGHAASRSLADRYTPCLRNAAGAQTSASARWVASSPGNHGR